MFSLSEMLAQGIIGKSVDYANPKEYRIAGITVMGAAINDVQAIKLFAGIREGDLVTIPGDRIAKAVRNLWEQDLFADVQIDVAEIRGEEIYLLIIVDEMPKLGGHQYTGIRRGEWTSLDENDELRTGVIANQNLKNRTINFVKKHFQEKGYFNTTVTIVEVPDPLMKNHVKWTIDVQKGPKVKISSINFTGATALDEKKLKRALKDTKEQHWYHIFKASRYEEEKYEDDKGKLVARYNKSGYRNARILSDSVTLVSDSRVSVNIQLEEGAMFHFRNISFTGNTKHTTGEIDSLINIQKGDLYNLELLNNKLYYNPSGRDLSTLYQDDGYLNFYVYPVETLVDGDSIDVELRISEGKQYRIGKITVVGNSKTNDHVIYREIRTRPGDLFNRSDVIRTQRELAALGYFNPEAFQINPIQHPETGLVDIEYVVEEKPSDQVELSGGWGGGRVVGSLGLTFNNFSTRNFFKKGAWTPLPSGDGQRLSIRAVTNGIYYQSYQLSFTEPWLGGKKANSLSLSAYHSVQSNGESRKIDDPDNPGQNILNPDRQALKITGGSVSYGKRLQKPDDWFAVFAGVSYQYFDLNRFGSFFSFSDGYSNNIALNFTLERNSTSDPIFPTWGSKVTFSTKLTPPWHIGQDYTGKSDQDKYALVEYHKWKFTAQWYTPLNKHKTHKLVLSANAGFGFLGAYNNSVGLAPFERFYLGGVFLSGFLLDGREIVNLRGYDDLSLTFPSDRVGSPVIAKYGMELRYPLSTNPNATIYALTFAEAGKTWQNFREFNPFNVYRSAGAGLRIFLPMFGMLGFDYGWRLDDVPNAPAMARGQFHFSIGMNLGEL